MKKLLIYGLLMASMLNATHTYAGPGIARWNQYKQQVEALNSRRQWKPCTNYFSQKECNETKRELGIPDNYEKVNLETKIQPKPTTQTRSITITTPHQNYQNPIMELFQKKDYRGDITKLKRLSYNDLTKLEQIYAPHINPTNTTKIEERMGEITLTAHMAEFNGIPEHLIPFFLSHIYQESKFYPKATSKTGAKGLGQMVEGTANEGWMTGGYSNAHNPVFNIDACSRYFLFLLNKYNQDKERAIGGYVEGIKYSDSNTHKTQEQFPKHIKNIYEHLPTFEEIYNEIKAGEHPINFE